MDMDRRNFLKGAALAAADVRSELIRRGVTF